MRKIYALLWITALMLGLGALPAEAAKPVDNDLDGYPENRDCNDDDINIWELNSCGVCAPEPVDGCECIPTPGEESEELTCNDTIDNDCDGLTDADDTADCSTGGGTCVDYTDKGLCNDDLNCEWDGNPNSGSCLDLPPVCEITENPEISCDDGIDNDCDELTDCDDSDCDADPICIISCEITEDPEVSCNDGSDNDCDDQIDCADPDCAADAACISERDVIVMASNDLGMHCACPGTEKMLLLPPFNTLRAQVIERGGKSPVILADSNDIRVEYDVIENYDMFNDYKNHDNPGTDLSTDFYFSTWMDMQPRYGLGSPRRDDPEDPNFGAIQGVGGAMLAGEMHAEPEGWWEIIGVPAFPDAHNSTSPEYIMVDPLGGPNRNPYLTAEVEVFEQSSNILLASTTTTVPVSFGGCCGCHLDLTADNGMDPNPDNSFNLMGTLHERDSGINFAVLDPDGDGVTGPVRCSVCHWDPAMGERYPGEATHPGGVVDPDTGEQLPPGGYEDPDNAGQYLPKSQFTFSDVLHRWHVENTQVLSYNPDLATDCYECHPSNNVMCYRGHHTKKTTGTDNHDVWCTDCHGDLHERVAENQLDQPWQESTLPRCQDCHSATGETAHLDAFGGSYLKSMAHKNDSILCSTCHGAPHALYPSNLAKDNEQNIALQGTTNPIGNCAVCHSNKKDAYSKPGH